MNTSAPKRVLLAGATGTIGRAVARALVAAGHDTVCLMRRAGLEDQFPGATVQVADVTDPTGLEDALADERFDTVISCLASRTGAPKDAWAIDHRANLNLLNVAKAAAVPQFVLLSAICVQRPKLAFQQAKLAFEKVLIDSGLTYSIVRPTAFFKSLSGQLDRVKAGKPFLVFGDGTLTACKPISDEDLADFILTCLDDPSRQNAILPIGGPGAALTPLDQGKALFEALGREPRIKYVPVALISTIIAALSSLGRLAPKLAEKAELARIGRYYATESMLVWNEDGQRYDADATPAHGTDTLADFYAKLARGEVTIERGDHAVF
ncbi:MAG: NAD(P)H-binding protein [Rhizobiales bacterium]|nr:NAD(P)H-binding protein [Hyphomicrobiales bacterium]MBO6700449.1 NAD(P)H-binding protein [Hyphomicrobiales bacterium]MBO6737985.1 NAD(P)H-binding protein [Hyphomicrobiales bacterium]MBO6913708.1 NAD(P)H-binding protein [Hyphomicrobiales bacterium]MBO6954396.1 NAD(P)H-binding protein [Hyphomicrobiales bacterium]